MSEVVLLATRNAGKLRELLPMLAAAGIRAETLGDAGVVETRDEDDLERFDSFEENALAKARWFSGRTGGRVVIADDSGLVVAALDGRPGVRSKRWSGSSGLSGQALDDENNAHLLAELGRVGATLERERSASYICAAACAWGDGSIVMIGATDGHVMTAPAGSQGFGYDPYFWSSDLRAPFAIVSREAKESVSHRGRAFRRLLDAMVSDRRLERKLFGPVDPAWVPG